MSSDEDTPRPPLLRVVRGEPEPDELAALVTVLSARAAAAAAASGRPEPTSAWRDRSTAMRRPLQPGPGAWRASAWPG